MRNTNVQTFEGEVKEALPNTMFRVVLADGRVIIATLMGRLRRKFVRIFPGDRVKIEMTEYDKDRGRIVYKF